jgi:hypothetical protein
MRVFLSYADEQRRIAEEVNAAVSVRGHEVFFDRSRLKAGVEYDASIQKAIHDCDLFVFLISPDSLREGKYTLTELAFAKEKWRNPSGRVLPVMAQPTVISQVEAYLRAVTILYPQGNLAAEVSANVDALLKPEAAIRPQPLASEELLHERIAAYKELWELTKRLPKWPRATGITYDDLRDLSKSLRDWYFTDGGGMFLSRTAHTAYSALQDSLTAILIEQPSGSLKEDHYDAVRELCSALRTTLAGDIGSRT